MRCACVRTALIDISTYVALTLVALARGRVIIGAFYLFLLEVSLKASQVCIQPSDMLVHLKA